MAGRNTAPGLVSSTGRSESFPVKRYTLEMHTGVPSGGSGATLGVVGMETGS